MENNEDVKKTSSDVFKEIQKRGDKVVRIYLEDASTGKQLTTGVSLPLNTKDEFTLSDACNLITEFTASKQDDDRSLIVTAHLKNGETWSELYTERTAGAFYPDLALDSFKMKLTHKIWEFMNSVRNLALVNVAVEKMKSK